MSLIGASPSRPGRGPRILSPSRRWSCSGSAWGLLPALPDAAGRRRRDPADAASISALMLLVGYLLAAAAPVVLGLVRDATGNFDDVVWILVAIAGALLLVSLSLTERRLRATGALPA